MSHLTFRIETALMQVVDRLSCDPCPPKLAQAIRYSVFPAGGRLRPRLLHAVATSLGERNMDLTDRAAASLELLHCASLIQDDLPNFDDEHFRRGRPALHRIFGSEVAILASDALILGAFENVAVSDDASLSLPIIRIVSEAAGSPHGAVAGQAWEAEESVSLEQYHRAKTAALFEAATLAGAAASGRDPEPWRAVGHWFGRAYQMADDVTDATSGSRDIEAGKPNAVGVLGHHTTETLFDRYVERALSAVPEIGDHRLLESAIEELARAFRARLRESREPSPELAPAKVAS